ncbi:MAG TPA: DUF4870 domain-containing protein [Flavobacterium sp.]|nr:DUF4870 domain-containing protein [Flavobacterium sp.]
MEMKANYTTAALLNLSLLSQYFIPFGSFIIPIIIWNSKKESSEYIDRKGKDAINFQLTFFLYSIALVLIAVPAFIFSVFQIVEFHDVVNNHDILMNQFNIENASWVIVTAIIAILLLIILKIIEFFLIIIATIQTSNGEEFKYPLTIKFLK